MTILRPLSASQAAECETAKNPECDCRCGGAFHGTRRVRIEEGATEREKHAAFEALPVGDPHHLPTKAESKQAASDRKTHRKYHYVPYQRILHRPGRWVTPDDYESANVVCYLCVDEGKPTKEEYDAAHPEEAVV